jgi:hypothetical protein
MLSASGERPAVDRVGPVPVSTKDFVVPRGVVTAEQSRMSRRLKSFLKCIARPMNACSPRVSGTNPFIPVLFNPHEPKLSPRHYFTGIVHFVAPFLEKY